MRDSGSTACRAAFNCCAEVRSCPKGFSTITRAFFMQPEMCERFDNIDKKVRRNCQIMGGAGCRVECFLQAIEGRRLLIITTDILKQIQKLSQGVFIDIFPLLAHAIAGPFFQMLIGSPSLGYTNHRYVQMTTLDHMIKSGKDLLVSEISHRPE